MSAVWSKTRSMSWV